MEEQHQLQRDTTALVQNQTLKAALNKLCPRGTPEQKSFAASQFASIDEVVAHAGTISEDTKARYRTRCLSIIKDAYVRSLDPWDMVADRSTTRDSWYTFKAGLHFFLLEQVPELKRKVDQSLRRQSVWTDDDREGHDLLIEWLVWLANVLASTPEGPPEKFKGDGRSKRSVRSKSASIRGLPSDWREQFASKQQGDFKLLVLIEAVTGCRPVELKNGVVAELTTDGAISFRITGAKLSKFAGQPWRALTVHANHGPARLLADEMGEHGSRLDSNVLFGPMLVNTYCTQVARAMKKVFPLTKSTRKLSAYSLRHQVKTDLLACGLSRETLAKGLGHATTKSASYYGGGVQGGSGAVKPRSVEAAREVKIRSSYPTSASSTSKRSGAQPELAAPVRRRKLRR
ncbi:MAG TPA: hypothetical protein VFR90_17325 [Methylibium sp.]|uniref:hypothetical protein n=1 Tax=Methylibium sp. TaxID=2067992 RepID=UPI002DBD1EE5|nr:hypothetical protein [Methylibium sp.]HEU4460886.1 hypothetical protein [Methylibium sp.]